MRHAVLSVFWHCLLVIHYKITGNHRISTIRILSFDVTYSLSVQGSHQLRQRNFAEGTNRPKTMYKV